MTKGPPPGRLRLPRRSYGRRLSSDLYKRESCRIVWHASALLILMIV